MKLKNKIIENRVGLLVTIGILLIVTIIVGISYAYFGGIEIKNNNTVSGNINTNSYIFTTNSTGALSITLDNDKLDVANASNDYSSYVSNTGGNINVSLDANGLKKVYCSYDLVYIPSTAYTPSSGATNAGLKEFTLSGTSDKGNSFSEVDVSGSSTVTLLSGIEMSIDSTVSEQWSFTVKYYNLDVMQDNVIGKTFGGNIKVANTNCSFNEQPRIGYEAILLDNGNGATSIEEAEAYIEGRTTSTTPDFSTTTTTNEGMYAAADDYTATTGMKSYYFRGAVNNNWLKYGKYTKDMYNCNNGTISTIDTGDSCTKIASSGDDIYWRIIRINGDGSIRMIYSGTVDPKSDSSTTGSNGVYMTGEATQIGTGPFNSSSNNPAHVGYMYTEDEQHGNSTSSTIKTTLENWYVGTTLKDNNLVADQIFCNDRSATTSESGTSGEISGSMSTSTRYYYGAYVRLVTYKSPKLTCTTESDKFTLKTSSIGNKTLDYPVGLITADEVAMAGGKYSTYTEYCYLYTNQFFWIGSPYIFNTDFNGEVYEFVWEMHGGVGNVRPDTRLYAIRPVISLSSKIKLSGNGTYDDVYTVVE